MLVKNRKLPVPSTLPCHTASVPCYVHISAVWTHVPFLDTIRTVSYLLPLISIRIILAVSERTKREGENNSCDNRARIGRREKEMIKEDEWMDGWMGE